MIREDPSRTTGHHRGDSPDLVSLAAAAVAGFALAQAIGTTPIAQGPAVRNAPEKPATTSDSAATGRSAQLEIALADLWGLQLALLDDRARLERLLEEIRGAAPNTLLDTVDHAIAGTSDAGLAAVLMSTIGLGRDDVDEIHDVKAFTRRLAEIAMEGIVTEDEPADASSTVWFSNHVPTSALETSAATLFRPDERFLVASFETDTLDVADVLVKWMRVDPPEIISLERHAVGDTDALAWVWVERDRDWPTGTYRADVYSGDDAMTRIATGHYSID